MAYARIKTIEGKEIEVQVIDWNNDILISEGFDKFKPISGIMEKSVEDKDDIIYDLKEQISYMERKYDL